MPQFTIDKDGHYKSGSVKNGKYDEGAFVPENKVPVAARNALKGARPGQVVDELGDAFDPSTDVDETEDEQLGPSKAEQDAKRKADATAEVQRRKDAKAKDDADAETKDSDEEDDADEEEYVDPNDVPVEQDEEGMGDWKRANGRTLSIFSNKPHEVVKSIAGLLVPMTQEEYDTKSDGEVIKKLKDLKKI